ncbi:MAG: uridine diphosphate-N-acetylglucosamine-binding protein YvcK [Actinomycetaceae bacterium]|nr:uridine diphosphate-N-acetylglucosamine-binding protein YvcK [Actinomycetaceae bacterium]
MSPIGRGFYGPKVVALGGGHGLFSSLSALRLMTQNVTAVVTVADDGGSSGRLREEFGVLPPGDLRMALSALCDDGEWGQTWRDVLQHRFSSAGPMNGHALGNLLILALWEQFGDSVSALDWVGQLLGIQGRVLPMTSTPLKIEALIEEEGVRRTIRGQVAVATSTGHVHHVALLPENPPAQPEAVQAILDADWVIFGPGSWYTSVIPHLLVPQLREALCETKAKRALALNLNADKETKGMDAADHIRSFHSHGPDLDLDVILADPASIDDIDAASKAARECTAHLMLRQVRMSDGSARHDPLRLAAAYRDAFEGTLGDVFDED